MRNGSPIALSRFHYRPHLGARTLNPLFLQFAVYWSILPDRCRYLPVNATAMTISTGFVVDDAIVVLENMTRHIEGGMPRVQAA